MCTGMPTFHVENAQIHLSAAEIVTFYYNFSACNVIRRLVTCAQAFRVLSIGFAYRALVYFSLFTGEIYLRYAT